eukprot:s3479_g15.t1
MISLLPSHHRIIRSADRRIIGSADQRIIGSADQRIIGSADQRISGSPDQRIIGSSDQDQRISGSSDHRISGSADHRISGAAEQRISGSADQRISGSSDQRISGSSDHRTIGSSDHRISGSSDQRISGSADRRISGSSDHGTIGSSDHRIIGSADHRFSRLSDQRITGPSDQRIIGPQGGYCHVRVPPEVGRRVAQRLQAEIAHLLPLFGAETDLQQLLPLQQHCLERNAVLSRPKAAVLSAAIASATLEEWFHRCASDFKQAKNSANLPGEPTLRQGRQWFGVLGNIDETYDFLTAFGLLSEEGDKGIELLLSETDGEGRSAWVSEGVVSKALRDEYFNRAGQARQKQRKKSHLPTVSASAAAASIAPPAMSFAIDPSHMGNHTDAFCRETCHPELPHHAHQLEEIRTSVCEFTFTWLSAYRHQTKHMNCFGFLFFLQEMAWSHNDNIFGQHAPR